MNALVLWAVTGACLVALVAVFTALVMGRIRRETAIGATVAANGVAVLACLLLGTDLITTGVWVAGLVVALCGWWLSRIAQRRNP